jgi:multidrug efflux pump subunit AcrB
VVLIFLRDLRATAISVLAIPLSIVPTFWAMNLLGFSLNAVSLLAITLVTGILVDDAIVEIENIVRHMRMGKSAYRASLQAADEIGLAVVATTMTIVAMFAPVSFMGGIAGQYFRQFGLTVAIAVTFSLLVARLITPLLAATFLRPHRFEPHGVIMRFYLRMLEWSLRHRFVTVALGAPILMGSLMIAASLPVGFLPTSDLSRSVLQIELPPGATIADTMATAQRITALLRQRPEVSSVYAVGGAGSYGLSITAGEVRKTTLVIDLVARGDRSGDQKAFERDMRAALGAIPDIRYSFGNGGGGREFTLILSGPDGAAVEQAARAMEREARWKLSVIANVVSTAALARPEIRIVPRLEEAADLGISGAQIAEAVRIATVGEVSANLAKFSALDRQVPIRVQLDERARGDLSTLDALRIKAGTGVTVPLAAVADTGYGEGPTTIERYDRRRRVAIEADLVGSTPLGTAIEQVTALPSGRSLPAGVTIGKFGDSEIMDEVFSSFSRAIAAGVLMVFAVLVLLFADAMQPVTILFSMPLAIGGAFIALLLTGNAINLSVIIGVLMLMGIVTKNAILLVDSAIVEVAGGVERTQALIDAGRKRAQPVIMTTAAMTAGMVPSALGLGEGGAFRSPMAIALIGGLLASTFLSLVFVPAAFTIMDDFGRIVRRRFSRRIGPKAAMELDGDEPWS